MHYATGCITGCFVLSVTTGSKRASDDGQDVEAADNGHSVKKPRQEESDLYSAYFAELKLLLPSRVSTFLQHLNDYFQIRKYFFFDILDRISDRVV